MNREKVKSLALVTLFISASILAGIKFDFFQEKGNVQIEKIYQQNYQDLLLPSRQIINTGNNDQIIIYNQDSSIYKQVKETLTSKLKEVQSITPVDYQQYQIIQNKKSYEIEYDQPIDPRLLIRSLFLNEVDLKLQEPIQKITIPLVDETNIYVHTPTSIYKVQTKVETKIDIVDTIIQKEKMRYYRLNTLYETEGTALIPLDEAVSMKTYVARPKLQTEEDKERIAKKIFQTKYDFVSKQIQTNGSITYTYNLGQQMLKLRADGSIYYINEELGSEKENDKEKSIIATATFLRDIEMENQYRLYSVTKTSINGKTGYEIVYSLMADGYDITKKEGRTVKFQVIGNKIHTFTGQNLVIDHTVQEEGEPLTPLSIINQNYQYLKDEYKTENAIELIDKIQYVSYIYIMGQYSDYVPAYQVLIDNKVHYYSVYTGWEV